MVANPAGRSDAASTRQTGPPAWRLRALALLGATMAILTLAAFVGLAWGTPQLSVGALWEVLVPGASDTRAELVVRQLRLPRLLLALVGGAALGLAGALLQGALRNPLAGPELIGVNAGAALVVGTLVIVGVPTAAGSLPLLALSGALLGGGIVVFAARRHADRVRILLVGAAITAVLHAALFAVVAAGAQYQLGVLFRFLLGSLSNLTFAEVRIPLWWCVVTIPAALVSARALNLLRLPDDVVAQLGMPVLRTRLRLLIFAALLVAPIVAVAGAIGWISLLAPHLVRQAIQTSDARIVLPLTALVGAALLGITDQVARLAFRPLELPVGALTTAIGGPVLLVLLRRRLTTLRS